MGFYIYIYIFKNERKKMKTAWTSFLMLEANKINSIATTKSPSINLLKEGTNEIIGVLSKVYTNFIWSWLCVEQHYLDNALKNKMNCYIIL